MKSKTKLSLDNFMAVYYLFIGNILLFTGLSIPLDSIPSKISILCGSLILAMLLIYLLVLLAETHNEN